MIKMRNRPPVASAPASRAIIPASSPDHPHSFGIMQIRQFIRPGRLENVGEDVLAFDLEMANSFRDAAPVICMIGTESYEAKGERCVGTLATITQREDEPGLIAWFLEHLETFAGRHDKPKLSTFSGTDNDLPWLHERIERFDLRDRLAGSLNRFENLDLRTEFHKRTQNDKISLKKLEELYGIERESDMSSRKVSFVLTDVLNTESRDRDIPDNIHRYLEEDVHHLLVILERWNDQSLEGYFLTEYEFLNRLVGLARQCRKMGESPPNRFPANQAPGLLVFSGDLLAEVERAVTAGTFGDFHLPDFPLKSYPHHDVERLLRRYEQVKAIGIWDRKRKHYRLGRQFDKPKGTLAVVRQKGRILMIRRAEHIERAPGYWGLPGGVLEEGELPTAGAVRELREEVGLEGEAVQLLGTSPSMNRHYELFWVDVSVEDGHALTPRAEEVAEARWVTPEEMATLAPLIPGALEGFRNFLGPQWVPRDPNKKRTSGNNKQGARRRNSRGKRR